MAMCFLSKSSASACPSPGRARVHCNTALRSPLRTPSGLSPRPLQLPPPTAQTRRPHLYTHRSFTLHHLLPLSRLDTHTLHTDPSCTTHSTNLFSNSIHRNTSSILEVVGEVLRKIGFLIVMEARLPPVDHRLTEHILDPRTANSRARRRRSRHASGRVARVAINLLELDRLQVECVDLRGCTRHRWRRRLLGRRLGCGGCTGGGLGGQ